MIGTSCHITFYSLLNKNRTETREGGPFCNDLQVLFQIKKAPPPKKNSTEIKTLLHLYSWTKVPFFLFVYWNCRHNQPNSSLYNRYIKSPDLEWLCSIYRFDEQVARTVSSFILKNIIFSTPEQDTPLLLQ